MIESIGNIKPLFPWYPPGASPQSFPAPCNFAFRPGYRFRVQLDGMKDHPRLVLFPSFEVIGSLRLTSRFLKGDPPSRRSIERAVDEVRDHLGDLDGLRVATALATGGSARGLRKEEGRYVNELLDTAKVKIHLNIRGGVGSINLIAE